MTDLSRWATWNEITAQPAIWSAWGRRAGIDAARAFVDAAAPAEIWLCGAGSSAYVGDILAAALEAAPGPRLRAVPTTDIVSRPRSYLAGRSPFVISFGRSGNSAETVGMLDALDVLAPGAARLNITCNPQGALATRPAPGTQHVILLPPATHDAGFAMTSSFTTMLLTAAAILDPCDHAARMARLAENFAALLPLWRGLADAPVPERIVFVGAGAMAFAARECALKVMELTAGRVPALWDSTLGFRHGPKSFVRGATDIVILTQPDPQTAPYDTDLAAELRAQFPSARVIVAGPGGDADMAMPDGGLWGVPLSVALGQVLAVTWSDRLGLNVDDPFAGQGTLSRVVAGVRLHPVTA
jgi:tagatose-6-phosphate ketose/aldose isomerase